MADDNAQSTKLEHLYEKQENKFNAIYKQADRWQKRFQGSSEDTVTDMLSEFRDFLCNFWNFLRDTGDSAAPASSLEMIRDLSTALAIVNNQWTTISRACEQRMDEDLRGVMAAIGRQAQMYYDRFIGYKRSGLPIVYFDKVAAISRSDFISHPLLSIPFCDIDPKTQSIRDILPAVRWESSLVHELGHYIYWNSVKYYKVAVTHDKLRQAIMQEFIARYAKKGNLGDIRKGINLVEIFNRWLEEVFADICGTLIEGPDYAESALDMALEAPSAESAHDDGEHPLPYLRPLIAIEALKWVEKRQDVGEAQKAQLRGRIRKIEKQWTDTWLKQSDKAADWENPRELQQGDGFVTGKDIEESIPLVVVTVLGRNTSAGVSKPRRRGDVTGNWFDPDNPDQEVNLGELFNYCSWLGGAESESRSARRAKGSSLTVSVSGFSDMVRVKECEPSVSFASLIEELEQNIMVNSTGEQLSDEEIDSRLRKALLSLGLEVRFGVSSKPEWAYVRYVGAGNGSLRYA